MSEVTIEKIAELLEHEFEPIKTTLNEHIQILNAHTATLDAVKETVSDHSATLSAIKETVSDHTSTFTLIGDKLSSIETTLDVHTKALDELIKDKKGREQENAVGVHRFDRLEHWAGKAGDKVGIKFDI